MKLVKIPASIFISLLLLLTAAVPAFAAPIPEDSIKAINIFTEDGKQGKSIDSCSFGDPVWEFPSEYQEKPVYGIDELGPNQTTVEVIVCAFACGAVRTGRFLPPAGKRKVHDRSRY